jgi:hypothetical protein
MNHIVPLIALAAMAAVGLDLVFRAEKHVQASAGRVARGRADLLESLSHRVAPGLENARAYRLIGLFITIVAAGFAVAILTGFLGE